MSVWLNTKTAQANWLENQIRFFGNENLTFTVWQILLVVLAVLFVLFLILFIVFAAKNSKKKKALKKAKAKNAVAAKAPAAAPAQVPAAAPAAAPAGGVVAVAPDNSYYVDGSDYVKKDETYYAEKVNAHVAALNGAAKDPDGYFVVDKYRFGALLHKGGVAYVQVYLYDKGETHVLSAPITVRVSDDVALEKAVFLLNVAYRDAKAL